MGKILLTTLKIFLALLLLAGLGLLSYLLATKMGWPIWASAIIFTGSLGILFGILFLKKYLLRKKERKFIQRIIDRDKASLETAPETKRLKLLELQDHWKESVQKLQSSHLRKHGNPLYVLPWFLVLGESRNGKTSAIKNARITSAITEVSRASGISGTRNCDWWFCEEAIILDTAGRYAIPVEEGPDLEEWREFLTLLSKYRKKEPLNGVIVVVSADNLLTRDRDTLKEIGQSIRLRIDQIMRIIGAKFPVYVLVTKMDLVHGFTHFSELLPEETLSQAMGYTNQRFNISWDEILNDCHETIGKHLRELRFLLINRNKVFHPSALMFPIEFERLIPKLSAYLEGLFEENPYQEMPLFRGIYFSSALRKGSPVSEFLEVTKLKENLEAEPEKEKGIFLKDFFDRILPKDRNLFSPIAEFLRWRRIVNNLGLMTYLFLIICAGGILSLSFYKNFSAMNSFQQSFYNPPKLTTNQIENLLKLDKMRLEILDLEAKNREWFIPRFELKQSLDMEKRLKQHFTRLFEQGFLNPLDMSLNMTINKIKRDTPVKRFVDYIGYAVIRSSILKEALEGKKEELEKDFITFTKAVFNLTEEDKELGPLSQKFGDIYYSYLKWSKNRLNFQEKLRDYNHLILQLLMKKGKDLSWLVEDIISNTPRIHLNDFWQVEFIGGEKNIIYVPGAYTKEGRENIKRFISLLQNSLNDKGVLTEFKNRTDEFWKWYIIKFFDAWYSFIKEYHNATGRIQDSISWQKLSSSMPTNQNPYSLLIERLHEEISSLGNTKGLSPLWVKEFNHLYKVMETAKKLKQKQKGSVLASLKVKQKTVAEDIEKKIDKKVAQEEIRIQEQAKAWNEYIDSLQKIELGAASTKDAYQMYAGCFQTLSGSSQNQGLIDAYKKYYKFKNIMTRKRGYPYIYNLAFGPLGFLLEFASKETACFLQEQWNEKVLSTVKETDPDKLNDVLFNKRDGVVWKYLNQVAKPFIGKDTMGYTPRKDFRRRGIPFKREFLSFLNRGAVVTINKRTKYNIVIETVPMEVNKGADIEPYYSSLSISCANGAFTLENYNYPNRLNMEWTPDKCGDVVLTIKFPDATITKRYPGAMGLARFLSDFRSGSKRLVPEDFPNHSEYLKHKNIEWIKLSFKFKGHYSDIVKLINTIPRKIPQEIVKCSLR